MKNILQSAAMAVRSLILITAVLCTCFFTGACTGSAPDVRTPPETDLMIYTSQEEEVYAPIIKEFSERTGMTVQVKTGTSEQLITLLTDQKGNTDCDIIFGVTIETLESRKALWKPYESPESLHIPERFRSADHSWTSFSTLPLVIMYNTKVVTYREIPTGWSSLLEPRWKGRVAFADPENSDIYAYAMMAAVQSYPEHDTYLKRFLDNLNYRVLDQISEVNSGVSTGLYSLGVTLEESAQILLNDGADIDYIYPEEGTIAISDGTAMVNGCPHSEAAGQFIDFTISRDVQRILVSHMNRRSVRDDITPLTGLTHIRQLPLADYALAQVPTEQADLLNQWRKILDHAERRADQ